MKSLSVVIPSYNQQEYLCDAIESVLNQTLGNEHLYAKYELIIVDDGSTDSSFEVALKYVNTKENCIFRKVVHQVNKGLASARNTGIMNAKGDYILFLDADDILLPNYFDALQKKIKETQADIISASFKCFGKGNEEVILMPNPKLEDFKAGNRIPYCSAIKREKLLEVGGYSPRMIHGYEDLHLTLNLLQRGAKIETIPEVLWLYRTKEQSMWTDAKEHHKELLAQINKDLNLDLKF